MLAGDLSVYLHQELNMQLQVKKYVFENSKMNGFASGEMKDGSQSSGIEYSNHLKWYPG